MQKVTALRDNTRAMLQQRPKNISAEEIAKEVDVTVSWVNLFAAGKIENPSVVTIETLFTFLKSKMI